MRPKALLLHAPGTNRDLEAAQALELAGAQPEIVPLNELRARGGRWADYGLLVLPGGFSYADALGAGKLLALDLNAYFADEVRAFVQTGKPVIGICNGFQALVKSGLLPALESKVAAPAPNLQSPISNTQCEATLTFNASGHFECRWITLRPKSRTCVWTRGLVEPIDCPVAHGEGNFMVADPSVIATLQLRDQIALTYIRPDGSPANGEYPHNPNGSIADIAGICNPQGNVLGLMPHPEDHIVLYQHPRWRRGERGGLGLRLFENGVRYAAQL
jgi:phosphoribosylformylglycinamidine synthase